MTPTPQEIALMTSIREKFHAEIEGACRNTSIPPEFLAALVANESSGDLSAHRFESGVLLQIWDVLNGRAGHFGSLNRSDFVTRFPAAVVASAIATVDAWASSWGLTQIMGYEIIPMQLTLGLSLADLKTPAGNLRGSIWMLLEFVRRFAIDPAKGEFDQLFDCWNTGRAHARTHDPLYVPNGLARLAIYRDLGEEPPKAVSA